MKRILILILSLTFISAEVDLESLIFTQFQRFIKKYQKNYSSMKEYLARFQVFRLNFKETLNLGSQNYLNGITKFSDLTRQEFAKKYLNSDFPAIVYLNQGKSPISLPKQLQLLGIGENKESLVQLRIKDHVAQLMLFPP